MLLDGTVAETDRVQAEGHCSGKVRREGVNLQVVTADEGTLLWISPALPGATHDVKAAREHDVTGTCTQLDLEVLADKGYIGAGGTVITPIRRRAHTELSDKHKASNKATRRSAPPSSAPSRGSSSGGSSAMPKSARTDSRQSPQPSPPP
ncbi:transposase family protein [Streptomyces sp. NPDC001139]